MAAEKSSILIVGAGYVGARVARSWRTAGARVTAWTNTAASARLLTLEGFSAAAYDLRPSAGAGRSGRAEPLPVDPAGYNVIYFCVAPKTPADAQAIYVDGYRRVLEALENTKRLPTRIVLAGSTGVIGEVAGNPGASVDESVPRSSSTPRAQTLCACEDLISGWCRDRQQHGTSAVILRLTGIYGPDRNPLPQLKAGTYRYPRDPSLGINLIHVTDAATALVRAADIAMPAGTTEIIHASDGTFPTRQEYIEAICRDYDLPVPNPITARRDSERDVANRRIANDKLKRLLLPELAFPSYIEGIASFEMRPDRTEEHEKDDVCQ